MVLFSAIIICSIPQVKANSLGFSDFDQRTEGYEKVVELVESGIINGYQDGTFKPYHLIKREHVAVLLFRAHNLSVPANLQEVLSVYKDVPVNHEYAREIAAVTSAGIFKGNGGRFNPKSTITRGQMASVLVRAFGLEDINNPVDLIDLNKIGPSHRNNVNVLAKHNITRGKPTSDGQRYFDGESYLTRLQFGVFLHNTMAASRASGIEKNISNIFAHDEDFNQQLNQGDKLEFQFTNGIIEEQKEKIIDHIKRNHDVFGSDAEMTFVPTKSYDTDKKQYYTLYDTLTIVLGKSPTIRLGNNDRFTIPKDLVRYLDYSFPVHDLALSTPSQFTFHMKLLHNNAGTVEKLEFQLSGVDPNYFEDKTTYVIFQSQIGIQRKDKSQGTIPITSLEWDPASMKLTLMIQPTTLQTGDMLEVRFTNEINGFNGGYFGIK